MILIIFRTRIYTNIAAAAIKAVAHTPYILLSPKVINKHVTSVMNMFNISYNVQRFTMKVIF